MTKIVAGTVATLAVVVTVLGLAWLTIWLSKSIWAFL